MSPFFLEMMKLILVVWGQLLKNQDVPSWSSTSLLREHWGTPVITKPSAKMDKQTSYFICGVRTRLHHRGKQLMYL